MATIGLIQLPLQLELISLGSWPLLFIPRVVRIIAGTVSPSAVWYTSLGFVRSGTVDLNTGALRNFGINGNGWSRVATVYGAGIWDARAYNLGFAPSGVGPSNNHVRWVGLPVRCLVY